MVGFPFTKDQCENVREWMNRDFHLHEGETFEVILQLQTFTII